MRAIGAKKRSVFSLVTTEAVIISLIGGVAGILTGGVLLLTIKAPVIKAFKLPYLWPNNVFIISVL